MELRTVVAAWATRDAPPASDTDVARAVGWIDTIQDLEEEKLVATVSLHALQRSASQPHVNDDSQRVRERMSEFAKRLNATDQAINELLTEILEFYTDAIEDADST